MQFVKTILAMATLFTILVVPVNACLDAEFTQDTKPRNKGNQFVTGRLIDNGVEVSTLDCPVCFDFLYNNAWMNCKDGYQAQLCIHWTDGKELYSVDYRYGGNVFNFWLNVKGIKNVWADGMWARVYA